MATSEMDHKVPEDFEKKETDHIETSVDNAGIHTDLEDVPSGYWQSYRFIGSVVAIILLANSLFIGYVMPVNILSIINEDIGPSPNYTLITLVFTLVSGVLLLVVGRLGDIIGRRYFMVGGQLLAIIGAIICATATSINMVVGGTVITACAGAVQTLFPLLIQEILPNKHRSFGLALISVGMFPTIGGGPAIARALVQHTTLGWRWCYWLNVIVSGISFLLFLTCYFPPNFRQLNATKSRWQEFLEMDFGGFFLYAGGLILLLLGFSWTEGEYSWDSPHVLATLIIGLLTIIAFFFYEAYMDLKLPLLPLHLLKIRNYVIAVIAGTVAQMVYYSLNVLWPQQISALYTTDNALIGWMSCTTGASLAFGEILAGVCFRAIGHYKWQLVVTTMGLTAFCGMMAAATQYTQSLAIAGTIIAGAFVGWIEIICGLVAGLVVPPDDIGTSTGFFASTRAVSGTIAAAIYVAIYSARLTNDLPAAVVPAVEAAGLPAGSVPTLFAAVTNGNAAALAAVPGINDTIIAALGTATKDANSSSFKVVYLSSLAFGGIAIIAAFFASNVDEFLTSFVNKSVNAREQGTRQERIEEKLSV